MRDFVPYSVRFRGSFCTDAVLFIGFFRSGAGFGSNVSSSQHATTAATQSSGIPSRFKILFYFERGRNRRHRCQAFLDPQFVSAIVPS